ncbi:MAG: serine hydrolase, partial [Candidatus Roizmanbacteria bacterium]|nr:serine hydrolase [Candidatus Roizmanbacteria bacterium]
YLLFTFFTLLFLFYPGDSYYFHLFAYNREAINKTTPVLKLKINPIPYLKLPYYPEVSAEGIYLVDLPSFIPILSRNENLKLFPASTTKILTALVAYDIYKPDQVITVKKTIADGQVMGLVVGEKITVENILYGTLIYSGNDAAYVLADNYGYDKFIDLMNEKANSLGMKNSHFVNPNGLDSGSQYSTAFDLSLAARELLKNPYLSKIVSIKEITISDVDFKYFHQLTNVNKLLGEIQGLGGLKTGYTENAGENLVSFYKKNGHQFVIVILKSQDRFNDTRNIVKWLDENIGYYSFTAGT